MTLIFATPKEVQQELALKLKTKRLAENLTQAGLATRSGISLGSLKRFEKTGEASLHAFLSIAGVLGCLDECQHLFSEGEKPVTLFKDEKILSRKRGCLK